MKAAAASRSVRYSVALVLSGLITASAACSADEGGGEAADPRGGAATGPGGGDVGSGGGVVGSGGAVVGSGGINDGGSPADGGGSTGDGGAPAGGTTAAGAGNGGSGAGGSGAGGSGDGGSGGAPAPVDCSAIDAAWDLCSSSADACMAVFDDGAGCNAVCAAAGLACAEAYENTESGCGADTTRPPLGCDPPSGHQSDYCVCTRDGSGAGAGGAGAGGAGNGGAGNGGAGNGGAGNGGTSTGGNGTGGTSTGGSGGTATGNAPCDVPAFIFNDTAPVGWAGESGGTTGGGAATPQLVTSPTQLRSLITDSTPRVLYVQGTFSPDEYDVGSNKTVIGCSSGAHVQGTIKIGSGSENLIFRNLQISGYGVGDCSLDPDYDSSEGCSSGNDAVAVNGTAHHVWFDHCAIADGTDGNLDITNNADFVTVSWTKFSYTPRTDNEGDDSTGGAGHRYSNLVGGTDTNPDGFPGTRPLNVTWHHNWWGDGVVERMPRVRFGRNHLFNNYYGSSVANYCVRAGKEARILLEANHFDGVDDPHEFNSSSNEATAYIAVGSGSDANLYESVSGDQATGGGASDPWTNPPYAYTVDPASSVQAAVTSGAGPQ